MNLIEYHRMPLVIEFNEETAPKIFKRSLRTHLIMFVSKASTSFDKKVAEFRQVAQPYRGKVGLFAIFPLPRFVVHAAT